MKRLPCASLMFKFSIGLSTTQNNFLKNLAVSHYFLPAFKIGSKLQKTVLVVKRLFWGLFSFQRIVYWHFEDNKKLQWWIAHHKLLFFWLIHHWNWSFFQTWIFSHFSIDGPVQCCPEKAILIQIKFFGWGILIQIKFFWWGKGCMKNRSWNLEEAFSEGCTICKPPAKGLKNPILIGLFINW